MPPKRAPAVDPRARMAGGGLEGYTATLREGNGTEHLGEIDLLAGPLFYREALTAPRQWKHFLLRSAYVASLLVLLWTAHQVTFSFEEVRTDGGLARFGAFVFQLFAIVQLSLVIAFSLLAAAGSVAQEKDRRTLILLLMTDLRDHELVLGKLLASLLNVGVLVLASLPVFCFVHLLGGFTLAQILWLEAICLVVALLAGAWGSLMAFWREKTFQTLALGALGAVLYLGLIEAIVALAGPDSATGRIAALLNPYRTLGLILNPFSEMGETGLTSAILQSLLALSGLTAVLLLITIAMVRRWNPSRSIHLQARQLEQTKEVVRPPRQVWALPLLWREVRTLAYGRKVIIIKGAYLLLAAFAVLYLRQSAGSEGQVLGIISPEGFAFVALSLVGLMLVNAQAVTSVTSERDGQTLELLLVTDVTAKEFVFSKLGGIFYNTKEVILVPLILAALYVIQGHISVENVVYLTLGYLSLLFFSAMLGIHAALSYDSSRTAITISLGTMFFLFIGIFVCMLLMVEARSSFGMQLVPFIVFILGGAIGLWASLTARNSSPALTLASGVLPFSTFYAITGYLLGDTLGVSLFVVVAYTFTTLAMLVPAVSEFDVALGRTTADKG